MMQSLSNVVIMFIWMVLQENIWPAVLCERWWSCSGAAESQRLHFLNLPGLVELSMC